MYSSTRWMFNELIARESIDCLEVTLIIWGNTLIIIIFFQLWGKGTPLNYVHVCALKKVFSFYLEPHILLFRRPITDHEAARRARECEGSKWGKAYYYLSLTDNTKSKKTNRNTECSITDIIIKKNLIVNWVYSVVSRCNILLLLLLLILVL